MIENALMIRVACFAGFFTFFAMLELWWPRRRAVGDKSKRWLNHAGIFLIDIIALRLLGPWIVLEVALWSTSGPLKGMPLWIEIPASLLFLDLLIYFQHRLMHKIPFLWRLHRLHHLDTDLDVSSGVRFHPFEIVLSMMIKSAAVLALGCSFWSVLIFEILLNAGSLFSHSNLHIPENWDRGIRWLWVTPDYHRIHHSVDHSESNRNFAFHLSIWDRLFKSYLETPQQDQQHLRLGVEGVEPAKARNFWRCLIDPIR